jgi:hypothetical protein
LRPPCDGQRDQANGSCERTQRTVALDLSALLEVLEALKAAEVDDRIRQAPQEIYQALIQAELTHMIGAAPHQRTQGRVVQHHGHRPRLLATTAGELELRIPSSLCALSMPSARRRVGAARGFTSRAAGQLVEDERSAGLDGSSRPHAEAPAQSGMLRRWPGPQRPTRADPISSAADGDGPMPIERLAARQVRLLSQTRMAGLTVMRRRYTNEAFGVRA